MTERNKWNIRDQAIFLERLGLALEKGYSLIHSLEFLSIQLPKKKQVQIHHAIFNFSEGNSIFNVFSDLKFSREALTYLYFAEKNGDLVNGLKNGSYLLKQRQSYNERLLKLMRYPMFLLCIMVFMTFFMRLYLIPQFLSLYQSFDTKPTSYLRTIMYIDQVIPWLFIALLLLIILSYLYYSFKYKRLSPIQQVEVLIKIPLFGKLISKILTFFFAVHMSSLLKVGLSFREALVIFADVHTSPFFQAESYSIRDKLTQGEQIEDIVSDRVYYENELTDIIRHGQRTGLLYQELKDYSQMLISDIDQSIQRIFKVVQPLLFASLGIVVILMYLAILLPIYNIMENL